MGRLKLFRTAVERELLGQRGAPFFWLGCLKLLIFGRGRPGIVLLIRLREAMPSRLSGLISLLIERRFGCYIHARARIGTGINMPHPVGIVIGEGVTIGDRCMIFQNVTIGGARRGDGGTDRYPQIADNVTIFAGAAIVGQVTIGSGATVGANAVVVRDAAPGETVVGVPARAIGAK